MTDIRESDDATRGLGQHRPAFSWPGRRRADQAAEAAEKAALEGLERLRGRTVAGEPDAPGPVPPGAWNGDELRSLVFEATQQLRDAIKVEANELGRLIQAEQETLRQAIGTLQELAAELRAVAPDEVEESSPAGEGSHVDELAPPADEPVDLNAAGHADLCAIGMSETQASRVIRHRDFWGDFHSVSELDHVPGFSPEIRAELDQRLSVWRDEETVEAD